MGTPSQQSTDVAKEIMDKVFSEENLKKLAASQAVDLFLNIQLYGTTASKWLK